MKQIVFLITIIYFSFSWADYEKCADKEREQFYNCRIAGLDNNFTTPPESLQSCNDAYKFGLSQCKEVYINKGK